MRRRTRRAWELRQAYRRRVQHRQIAFPGQTVDAGTLAARGACTGFYCGALDERDSFLPEMVLGRRARWEAQTDALGYGFELRGQLGKLRCAVRKSSNSSPHPKRKTLHARAICLREIFHAYTCIFLIESACLFPAVWMR